MQETSGNAAWDTEERVTRRTRPALAGLFCTIYKSHCRRRNFGERGVGYRGASHSAHQTCTGRSLLHNLQITLQATQQETMTGAADHKMQGTSGNAAWDTEERVARRTRIALADLLRKRRYCTHSNLKFSYLKQRGLCLTES
jgi:hypothetical protein